MQWLYVGAMALVLFGLVAICLAIGRHRERKRQAALAEISASLGLTWSAAGPDWLAERYQSAAMFDRGQGREFTNLMHGDWRGRDLIVFDSHWYKSNGQSRTTYRQTVIALRDESLDLPPFDCHPAHWPKKFREFMSRPADVVALDLNNRPDLAERWQINAADHTAVSELIDGTTANILLGDPGWWIEARGADLFVCKMWVRPKLDDLEAYLTQATTLLGSLLDHWRPRARRPE